MQQASVQSIVQALNQANVRYLIAGGLAVVAHGYVRLTLDVDLILDLDSTNVKRALQALGTLGYIPRVPVPMEKFADPETREKWIAEKGMTVFSLYSPLHELTQVDLFVREPLDFDAAFRTAFQAEVSPGLVATFVNAKDLIEMKKKAARPKDLLDIDQLRRLHGE